MITMDTGLDPALLQRPPFTLGKGTTKKIGKEIAAVFTELEKNLPHAMDVWVEVAKIVGLDKQSPYYLAGLKLARSLDNDLGTGLAGQYHFKPHFIRTVLSAAHLIQRWHADPIKPRLGPVLIGKILFASLGHDYFYDIGGNSFPFRLERIAFKNLIPFLTPFLKTEKEEQRITRKDIRDIGVMIFATEASVALKVGSFIQAVYARHFGHGPLPSAPKELGRLNRLVKESELALGAVFVRTADTFPSTCLTYAYTRGQSLLVAKEIGIPLKTSADIANFISRFFENVLNNHVLAPAEFYRDNTNAIIRSAQRIIDGVITPHRRRFKPEIQRAHLGR